MKWCILFIFFVSIAGCDFRKREDEIKKKQEFLDQKEQELLLKEKSLALKEADLINREKLLDSTMKTDTGLVYNAALPGVWHVRMTCTEATCKGSAVGDMREEDWELIFQGKAIIVKAMSGSQLVRVYTGFYTGNTIELVEKRRDAGGDVNMIVRLRLTEDSKMEGQREINRSDCKVIYDLKLAKNSE